MNALIVDDHEIVRDGLAQLLKDAFPVHSILYASDGREAIQKALNYDIDLVLLDLSMPEGLDGLLALQEIRKIIPKAKIIIFTMYDDIYYQKKAFHLGADGYLVKRMRSAEIIKAIQQILNGKKIVNGQVFHEEELDESIWETPFSPREQEVFILTVQGYTQKEIADKMNISVRTVENHRRNISKKLGTKNKRDWIEFAKKYNLLEIY